MDENDSSESDVEATGSLKEAIDPGQANFKTHIERFAYVSNGQSSQPREPSKMASKSTPATDSASAKVSPASIPVRRASSRKRGADVDRSAPESAPKKKRSTAKERSAKDPQNLESNLVDSLRPGLILVICGLNPGLQTASTGHAYAHPSNRFWHLLHESGITPKKHLPRETHDLPDLYKIGNTNICARPTRDGSTLTKEELQEGAKILEEKVRMYKPEAIAIVGKQIWESLWLARTGKKIKPAEFKWGWQDEHVWLGKNVDEADQVGWHGARTFVTTSTSGLSATLRPHEKLEIWRPLGEWFTKRRKELIEQDEGAN